MCLIKKQISYNIIRNVKDNRKKYLGKEIVAIYSNQTVFNWLYSFHMPLFFLAAGWVYKEKTVLTDIKRRIQTIVIPYFSFGFLVLIYWQLIERRFRDSDMSFIDSLFGLFSGCYDNLDFNIHLWFLPCFFVTVVLFNIIVNLGGRRTAYLVSALMSLVYIVIPMHTFAQLHQIESQIWKELRHLV